MSSTPRRWLEVSVRSPSAGEQDALLAEGLVVLGGRAVEERDGWYTTHVPEPADVDGFVEQTRVNLVELSGFGDVEVRTRWQEHEDWAETWKRGLAPRRITGRLIVTPSWEEPETLQGDVVVVIDPGMAFGTAEHGTTRGCLRLLDRAPVEGARLLDVGAGSGILSITAAKLGAAEVIAVEGDALACEALSENLERNDVASQVTLRTGWADVTSLAALAPRDGVVANIETGTLRPLIPGFRAALRPGGWLILSGITREEWPEMCRDTEAVGFRLIEPDTDGDWMSGWFVRDAPSAG